MAGLVRLKDDDTREGRNACGYTVKNNLNEKIGKVNTVIVDADSFATCYIVIEASGLFMPHKYVVRADEITGISDEDKTVFIAGLTNDKLKNGGYEEFDESWWARHNSQSEGALPPETPARTYPAELARDGAVTNQVDGKHRLDQGGEPGRSDERVRATEAMMRGDERAEERGIPGSAVYSGDSEGPLPDATSGERGALNTTSSLQPEGPAPASAATRDQFSQSAPRQSGLGERGSSANPDGSDGPITP